MCQQLDWTFPSHIIMIVGHIKSVLFAFQIPDNNKYFFFDSLFQYIGCVVIILVAELVIGVYIAVERKNVSFQPTHRKYIHLYHPSKARYKDISYMRYNEKLIPFY